MEKTVKVSKKKKKTFKITKKNQLFVIGCIMVTFVLLITIFGGYLEVNDPTKINLPDKAALPCAKYPLGTDSMGRCLYSRILEASKITLGISFCVVAISTVVGLIIGSISGYVGGILDHILMRLTDILMAFPGTIFALVILAIMGVGMENAIISLAFVSWTGFARLARGEVLSLKNCEYIEAARAIGNNGFQIMIHYILPNIISKILVMATLDISKVIMASSALSFLGLGVQPPTPEWGSMLNEGRAFIQTAPHITFFTGLAILIAAFSFNILGDGIRDMLDPSLRDKVMD